ncbi:hypothetical protein UlMin_042244 [Ulmus minor]
MDENQNTSMQENKAMMSLSNNTIIFAERSQPSITNSGSSLLGKFLSPKPMPKVLVQQILCRAWNTRRPWTVVEPGRRAKNMFVFLFEAVEDKRMVLERRPWTVKGNLLLLNEWDPDTPMNLIDFSKCALWVQLHGIPPSLVSKENVGQIAATGGEVMAIEYDSVNAIWSEFIRVKVQVELKSPLKPGVFIPLKGKQPVWVQLKYEKIGDFCYKCGRLGHDRSSYLEKEVTKIESTEGRHVPVYGPWLRVDSKLRDCFSAAKLRSQTTNEQRSKSQEMGLTITNPQENSEDISEMAMEV